MSDGLTPGRLQALPVDGINRLVEQVLAELRNAGLPPEAAAVATEIFTRALGRVRIARPPRPPRPWRTPNGHGGAEN